ncbi:MAG: hypothetical protein QM757_17075 [Paludibaculum sp.]
MAALAMPEYQKRYLRVRMASEENTMAISRKISPMWSLRARRPERSLSLLSSSAFSLISSPSFSYLARFDSYLAEADSARSPGVALRRSRATSDSISAE